MGNRTPPGLSSETVSDTTSRLDCHTLPATTLRKVAAPIPSGQTGPDASRQAQFSARSRLAGMEGLEPTTFRLTAGRSDRLSYTSILHQCSVRSEHLLWCRRRESNPHGCIPADFKSAASACSATPTSFNFVWWNQRESNSQPPACKAGALPIELCSQIEAKYRGVAPRNSSLFVPSRNLSARDFKHLVHVFGLGAGDGNRTRIPSLED